MNYFVVLIKVKGKIFIIYDFVFGERKFIYFEVLKYIIGIVFEVMFSDIFSFKKFVLCLGFS